MLIYFFEPSPKVLASYSMCSFLTKEVPIRGAYSAGNRRETTTSLLLPSDNGDI